MPYIVLSGIDSKGPYYRTSESLHYKKYYYKPYNERSKKLAYKKALKQNKAILLSELNRKKIIM